MKHKYAPFQTVGMTVFAVYWHRICYDLLTAMLDKNTDTECER